MSKTDQELMDDFLATTSYDKEGDWRKTPVTGEEPNEDETPVVRIDEAKSA